MTHSFRKNLKAFLYLQPTAESESGMLFRAALLGWLEIPSTELRAQAPRDLGLV